MDSPSDFQRKTVSSKVSRCFAWQQSETLLIALKPGQHDRCFHLSHIHNSSIIIHYHPGLSHVQNPKRELHIPTESQLPARICESQLAIKALPIRRSDPLAKCWWFLMPQQIKLTYGSSKFVLQSPLRCRDTKRTAVSVCPSEG